MPAQRLNHRQLYTFHSIADPLTSALTGWREAATPSGVPLSDPAREVLRALVHGLELREIAGEWIFVGHWQDPARSGVSPVVIRELFGFQFICQLDGSQVVITKAGAQALSRLTIDDIAAASKWWRGKG
jgi:hypothetical protein